MCSAGPNEMACRLRLSVADHPVNRARDGVTPQVPDAGFEEQRPSQMKRDVLQALRVPARAFVTLAFEPVLVFGERRQSRLHFQKVVALVSTDSRILGVIVALLCPAAKISG
jgi:hypothetical protein